MNIDTHVAYCPYGDVEERGVCIVFILSHTIIVLNKHSALLAPSALAQRNKCIQKYNSESRLLPDYALKKKKKKKRLLVRWVVGALLRAVVFRT
jgi:hypothetical protein